jgi:signal transduction histidine kinase
MAADTSPKRGVYDLPAADGRAEAVAPRRLAEATGLPEGLLSRNVLWFCRLRWIVIGLLALLGGLSWVPGLLPRLGLLHHRVWPFVAAGALLVANVLFLAHARRLAGRGANRGAGGNLWAQIATDLVVLTAVVHFVGSLETYVAFAYLFHIVLACIFFSRGGALLVTGIACVLYLACVVLEETRVVPPAGLYANRTVRRELDRRPSLRAVNVGWAMVTWVAVWYLASHLAARVRERDRELAETNRRLVATQEERRQHMLQTAHELKAPFSAIHANVQLLTKGLCGELPPEAREVLDRIAARSRRLAAQIQEMLQLANLQSTAQEPPRRTRVDLAEALRWCLEQVQPLADQRQVHIEANLIPVEAWAVPDHLKMLFDNLLANAVAYSHRDGAVQMTLTTGPDGAAQVTVEDHGIGIAPEKLPHLFTPYYRTDEGAQHNPDSTGLGLAIVRHVAETHGLAIRAESTQGEGTRFVVSFPATSLTQREGKEDQRGLPTDRG